MPRCFCVVTFGSVVPIATLKGGLGVVTLPKMDRCLLPPAIKSIHHVFAQLVEAAFIDESRADQFHSHSICCCIVPKKGAFIVDRLWQVKKYSR